MPDDRSNADDFDFAGEMKNLANQAQSKSAANTRADRNEMLLAVGQLIRPLAQEVENVKRSNLDLASLVNALNKSIHAQHATPQVLDTINQQMQRLGSVESANQKLFDALHTELKGYKDNFLFDALQKPFIKDQASIFDDLSAVHEQILKRLNACRDATAENGANGAPPEPASEIAFLQTLAGNVENQIHHMIEIFLRMDVAINRTACGAPIDKKTHRVVGFEPAASEDDDGLVARSMKPGFSWRDRAIRPEEVLARRWRSPAPAAPAVPVVTPRIDLPPGAPPATENSPA